eukprot:3362976-Amphidinium_carterae.1
MKSEAPFTLPRANPSTPATQNVCFPSPILARSGGDVSHPAQGRKPLAQHQPQAHTSPASMVHYSTTSDGQSQLSLPGASVQA